jgi:exodeoxyribonuclease VII large subunit
VREVDRRQEQLLGLLERARRSVGAELARADSDVTHIRARLIALSPAATLRRGYAIVQHADSRVVLTAAEVSSGESLSVRFADNQLQVTTD